MSKLLVEETILEAVRLSLQKLKDIGSIDYYTLAFPFDGFIEVYYKNAESISNPKILNVVVSTQDYK